MGNLMVVETGKSFEEACRALETAVPRQKFGILHIHDLKKKLAEKGMDFQKEVRVFDICNPQKAKETLERNVLVASMLPCAIAVCGEGKGAKFVCARPTVMLDLLETPELKGMAAEVEEAVSKIMNEAAG